MQIEVKPPFDRRLTNAAKDREMSVDQLVESVLSHYFEKLDSNGGDWVHGTQAQLGKVWPAEDFSSWGPPCGA